MCDARGAMELHDASFSELHDARIVAVETDPGARTVTLRFKHVAFYFREGEATLHVLYGFGLDLVGEAVSEVVGGPLEPDAWVMDGAIHTRDGREIDLVEVVRAPAHDVSVTLGTDIGTRFAFRATTLRIAGPVLNGFREESPF